MVTLVVGSLVLVLCGVFLLSGVMGRKHDGHGWFIS